MSLYKRWMVFVDGENLTLRAQCIAQKNGIPLHEGKYWLKDTFMWTESLNIKDTNPVNWSFIKGTLELKYPIEPMSTRSYYYTSIQGDSLKIDEIKEKLRNLGFHPEVFKKPKGKNSKGVDITLAKDILSHSFRDNLDVVVLVAGDEDYLPLLEEIKRLGKIACLYFFEDEIGGLSPKLRLASDFFQSIDKATFEFWREQNIVKS